MYKIIRKESFLVPAHTMPSNCWTKMYEYNLLELFSQPVSTEYVKVFQLVFQ